MNPSLINPYIRVAMECIIPAGHNIACRVIYDYEIIYIERGEFTLMYDGVDYRVTRGDFIFIHPGVKHSFHIDDTEISQPHIHFDVTHRPASEMIPISFKDVCDMNDTEREWIHKDYFTSHPEAPFIRVRNKENFLDIFYKIISNEIGALTRKALMTELLSIIIDDNFPDLLEKQETLPIEMQVKDYLDAGNGLAMSLDDFSKNFHYNKFYLEKKFKKAFGAGLIEYRNSKRMEYANQLLARFPVSKTAETLGYKSIYSFSRAYKEHYGIPPSKHRRKV